MGIHVLRVGITNWIGNLPSRMRDEGLRRGTEESAQEVISHLLRKTDGIDSRVSRYTIEIGTRS